MLAGSLTTWYDHAVSLLGQHEVRLSFTFIVLSKETRNALFAGVAICANLHTQWGLPFCFLAVCQNHPVSLVLQAYVAAQITDCRSEDRCDDPRSDCATTSFHPECVLVWQDSARPCEVIEGATCKGKALPM